MEDAGGHLAGRPHRAAEGSADERCHHRVSQGRAPLSQPKVRKILDTTNSKGAATMPFRDFREVLDALRNAGELLELDRAVCQSAALKHISEDARR
jgi:hypothetical protein